MRLENGRSVDLNLLVVLEALLVERHVTRAAKRLHMSQPAVSRALADLRRVFAEDLLVRVGQRMQLTARGEALLPGVQRILGGVRELASTESFDPARATGRIKLAAPDIIVYMLGPPLLRRLQDEAPGLDVEVLQWSSAWREQLASGEVDLTFGLATESDRGIYSSPLVQNTWATVVREGHPVLSKPWSLDSFAGLRHLMIGFTPHGGGHVDAALASVGRQRRVALRMPYVVLSPLIVAETDLVLTTARWLAEKLAKSSKLVVRAPPTGVTLAPVDLPLVWHERSHRDPVQRWLRATLTELARTEGMAPPAAKSRGGRDRGAKSTD